ncbi:hypothetical protein [Streptomyces canus]
MRGLGDHLSIGERIAFYRKRRGYTQEVLAGGPSLRRRTGA